MVKSFDCLKRGLGCSVSILIRFVDSNDEGGGDKNRRGRPCSARGVAGNGGEGLWFMANEYEAVSVLTGALEMDGAEPVLDLAIMSVEVGQPREEISDGTP
ncbi:unnamed protein product [Linum trigynum]|uniref:Uncharacterized protein n=1 Tax=Linum trigynum TaxID=586398 RepID=A0AAV2G7H2_9ROSI